MLSSSIGNDIEESQCSFPGRINESIAIKEWNTFFYNLDNSVSFFKGLIKQPVKLQFLILINVKMDAETSAYY